MAKADPDSAVFRLEEAIANLCQESDGGVTQKMLQDELPDIPLEELGSALNVLLSRHQLQMYTQASTLYYKPVNQEDRVRFRGLGSEEMLVYQIIQASQNMGIWTRDLKLRSNLQQPQITKIIKTLEGRRLIKAVKSVASKNRKVYMLYEIEPSREITGGAWYTEQEFDAEFIGVLREAVKKFVENQGKVTLEEIAAFVKSSGATKVDLRLEDYQQVANTLVYDGEVEEISEFDPDEDADTTFYRMSPMSVPETNAFTSIPCGVCPVLHECSDDGLISPATCVYYQEWLQF
ncbi:DNA-directed RNA polymerase III subunit RPC6 [Klebsormidium nitens]|uniref:DNA-directed RNA polymerase III subunit RPC6 n=1 Tax=Klebsormidium nitens TaxID=105231 RepID=A0A1Y1IK16_KLENI|nr:DNA-directed RNA polymerase III subunit RPC6 [Klebsormidium nitens]|eukprot:GAQ88488.1 DNA-directed RNA polymerase III subunit RPC6 [Klebsormidium nitens]